MNQYLPPRGILGVFNRSYCEDILISRVHPEIAKEDNAKLKAATKELIKEAKLNKVQ
ncbi:hypothetical protein [Limosilactobacillus equigenerosi]|uniref:hypothetical protein n=1 Tax=Limosilactobacillus equigenerosi TaxID=417373 RepID=UPI001CDB10A0|nr:hypothetical protein [Limosilactobacillus equigenerosi]